MNKKPIIHIICGPTASGKTSVALKLAETYPLEIISADSRQVIKYLDVGTAKPTPAEQAKVNFHLIDLIEPGEKYSASQFLAEAELAIEAVLKINKIPLIVGGTGLYLRTLSEGIVDIKPDEKIRQQLEDEARRIGKDAMYDRLCEIDPEEAQTFHANNLVRTIRALEIYKISGQPKSELMKTGLYKKSKYAYHFHCLTPERDKLYERINSRVDDMLEYGLENEINNLIDKGKRALLEKSNVIGYTELLRYKSGEISRERAIELIKQNTRNYAKRQLTWFRNQTDAIFYETSAELYDSLSEVID